MSAAIMSRRFIYAFDFDGVLVDSASELARSGFDAATNTLFPDAPWLEYFSSDETKLVNEFHDIRPCLETGWETPLLLKLLAEKKLTNDEIMQQFHSGLMNEMLDDLNLDKDACNNALKKARNDWIERDVNDWIDAHGFYQEACDAVYKLLQEQGSENVYVITTKAADFTMRLLEKVKLIGEDAPGGGILPNHVFGLGSPPKQQVLASLLEEKQKMDGNEWGAVFVEDRLLTLEKTMTDDSLNNRVVPVLASWGYNTPQQRGRAREAGYIVLDQNDSSTLSTVLLKDSAKVLSFRHKGSTK